MNFDFTPEDLKNDFSGKLSTQLYEMGWESKPIVDFGGTEYMILHQPIIKPGRQRAEVLNVTEFNETPRNDGSPSYFKIARDESNRGYVFYADEGWGVLTTTPDGKFYEYTNPFSAVLTYRVDPPTKDDAKQTADEMDDELQDSIDSGGSLKW